MMLRVVLVGIVAGLGISPPSAGENSGWTRKAQTWLEAGLLALNGPELPDEDDSAREALAESEPAGPDDTAPVVSADDEPASDLADAVYLSEDEDVPAVTVSESTVTAEAAEALVFDAVIDEMVAEFSRAEVSPPALADVKPALPVDALDDFDLGLDLDDTMEFVAEAIATAPARSEATPAASAYEPLELDDELYPGETYVLNRGEPAPAVQEVESEGSTGSASTEKQLGNAVRLTRDAVYAWINLLQSPAIVTISR
jgi:hypothetical protein